MSKVLNASKTAISKVVSAITAIDTTISNTWSQWAQGMSEAIVEAYGENLDDEKYADDREEILTQVGTEQGWIDADDNTKKSRKTEVNRILKGAMGAGTTLGAVCEYWHNQSLLKNGGVVGGRKVSKQVVLRIASNLPKSKTRKECIEKVLATFKPGSGRGAPPKTDLQEIQSMIDKIAKMKSRAKGVKAMQAKLKSACRSKDCKEYFTYPAE